MVEEGRRSPRLKQLSRDLARGDDAALDLFWREVRQKGTPLVESVKEKRDFTPRDHLLACCRRDKTGYRANY